MKPAKRPRFTSGDIKSPARLEPALRYQPFIYLMALGLVIAAATILCLRPITDSDFWHHLSFGRILVEEHRFPATDELSFTAEGRPWISSGWFPSTLLYRAYRAAPDTGVVGGLVCGVGIVLGLFLLIYGTRQCKNPVLATLLCILALAAATTRLLPRPDIFSVLLIAPLIVLLISYERAPLDRTWRSMARAALMPEFFLIWANCHMLFVIGFAIASLFIGWVWLRYRKTLQNAPMVVTGAWLLSGLACLATPYGIKASWFILENARLDATSTRINELKPLLQILREPAGPSVLVLFGLWAMACAWLLWRSRSSITAWQWATILLLLGLTLIQRRQVGLAATGITIIVMANLRQMPQPAWLRSPWFIAAPAALFGLLLFARLNGYLGLSKERNNVGPSCEWLPCEAVSFLKSNPPPPGLFHDLYTGGYLGYQLAPKTKVFIDGRLEVFNNGAYNDFFAPPEGRKSLRDIFERYGVKSVLLDWRAAGSLPGHTAAMLSDQPDWQLCWFSDHYALFVHKDDQTTSYTAAHGYKYLNPLRPAGFLEALQDPETAPAARADARKAITENPQSALAARAMQSIEP